MTFSGRRKPMGIMPKAPDIPWVQLIAKGGPSAHQTLEDGSPRMIPVKRAWRIQGWPALDLEYVQKVGVADPVASREATRAPWARA